MGSNSACRLRFWQACLAFAVALLAFVCAPSAAFARSYTVDEVDIFASIDQLGGVWITERRTYTFDGAYNGIVWELPCGTYGGKEIVPQVYASSVEAKGETTQLYFTDKIVASEGLEAEDGTYELAIDWAVEDETVTFEVEYLLDGLVRRWSDVAELYWQYVPADPGGDTWHNITLDVTLPVPDDVEVVAGENVGAWGHGPLTGEVRATSDGVRLTCPVVEADDYLEARVVFPATWVPLAEQTDEAKLDTILEEEAAWVEEANAKRARDRAIAIAIPSALGTVGLGSVVLQLIRAALRRKKTPEPTFTEEYLRDVPNDDHPVVWGQLMDDGKLGSNGFAATMLRLADQGRVSLDVVRDGDDEGDWQLTRSQAKSVPSDTIDATAYRLLFETVPATLGTKDGAPVLVSQINEAARIDPNEYLSAYNAWYLASRGAYRACGYEREDIQQNDLLVGCVGILDVAIAVVLGLVGMFLAVPTWLLAIGVVLCFAGGIWCIWHFDEGPKETVLTQEGVDLKARLEALRRWLTDFTRLDEAVPTDVLLWNRLLVAATVLGVAREVVEQLRVHVPALFGNGSFVASSWVSSDESDSFVLPYSALGNAALRAESEASDALDRSSSDSYGSSYDSPDSSASGSGGGFSGGGGGGFSGGGRGGAF